jgi:uncharacterized protein (DUF169 family)
METDSSRLTHLLGLVTPPVAIAFCDQAPAGTARAMTSQPASCGYWSLAAAGRVFYTEAADHKSCPVGAHTHGVPLTDEDQQNLQGLIGDMVGLGYLDPAEVPSIPHRTAPFGTAVYAPLDQLPVAADVVMIRGTARQLMLLAEAAHRAGVAGETPTMGRPTCAILPQAIDSQRTQASFGCIGNRVYTGLDDAEAWYALPGGRVNDVLAALETLVRANRELETFHRRRASTALV